MHGRFSSGVSPGSSRFSSAVPSDQLLCLPLPLMPSEEDDELQVLQRRVAGLEQVLVGGAERPVVVLAASVDALERLLVQQAHEVVAACDELHLLHHEEVVIHRGVELRVYGRELMLAGGDLVVLGLVHRGVELRVYGRELMLAGGDLVVLGLGRNAQ